MNPAKDTLAVARSATSYHGIPVLGEGVALGEGVGVLGGCDEGSCVGPLVGVGATGVGAGVGCCVGTAVGCVGPRVGCVGAGVGCVGAVVGCVGAGVGCVGAGVGCVGARVGGAGVGSTG